jgi:hypothetical protein
MHIVECCPYVRGQGENVMDGRTWLLGLLVLVGCGDPAEFRPARDAKAFPSTKAAFRVHEPPDGCDPIGVVHAKGELAIDWIAETAANHGGTHYVVRRDHSDEYLETRSSAVTVSNLTVGHSTTRVARDRFVWAEVYRCEH